MSAAEQLNRYGDERDYPFDPELPLAGMHRARGLDRLRWIEDARMRRDLYELFFVACRNEKDPRIQEEIRQQREAQQLQRLRSLRARASAGKLGQQAQQVVERITAMDPRTGKRPPEEQSLKLIARALKELKHGPEPDGGWDVMVPLSPPEEPPF